MTGAATKTVTLSHARTHLHQLVREAEQGAVIGITLRGKLVAWLTPVPPSEPDLPKHQAASGSAQASE
ncbi:type II toxin-antitoxin system prevent-host-death family antitoxin [Deinococcus aluminii]|uniref:type II toxin-antitoxin system Phd/YefM family antitoxin n=1 Tax=Deinococcus aluminii TaxID=1656885 RepID=UPI0031E91D4C